MDETIVELGEEYRRTSVKTKDLNKLQEKVEYFESRGETVVTRTVGGYHYLYVKKEKPLEEAQ